MTSIHTHLVSIVLPTYNSAKTLARTIESLLAQTYPHIEIIIIDDGSTDNTGDVVAPFLSGDKIRYITQPNSGVIFSLNRAISLAKGHLIARADADDYYEKNRIETQVETLLKDSNCTLSTTNFYKVYPDGDISLQVVNVHPDAAIKELFKRNYIMHSAVMFRKRDFERVGGYSSDWTHIEDWELWFRLLTIGKLNISTEPLSYLLVHGGSISAKKEREQTRMGIALRAKLLNTSLIPPTYIVYLIKPIAKYLVGMTAIRFIRKVSGLKR